MDYFELGYYGLFLICLLSATIIPLASEGVLLAFLAASYDPYICLLVAGAGNSLGGVTNYWLGMLGKPEMIRRLFKKQKNYQRLLYAIRRYGVWLGLLSWAPFIGDPLTIVVGFFRVRFLPFLLLMIFGKFLRYYVIIFLWN